MIHALIHIKHSPDTSLPDTPPKYLGISPKDIYIQHITNIIKQSTPIKDVKLRSSFETLVLPILNKFKVI